jgi:hypothetical protein
MKIMTWLGVLAFAACSSIASAGPGANASAGSSVTTIRVNGDGSLANFYDPSTDNQGFVYAARDQATNISSLDFSYVTPTSDPDIVILVQGAGEIPNSAFEMTKTTAHLSVVTPFRVIRCEIDRVTADFSCVDTDPIAFDLTWVVNGFFTVQEHVSR